MITDSGVDSVVNLMKGGKDLRDEKLIAKSKRVE